MHRLLSCAAALAASILPAQQTQDRHAAMRQDLGAYIEQQMADKRLPAVCIACIDVDGGSRWQWATGFGDADGHGSKAGASTVHRVASISKLFTDTAAMVLVQQGRLDLDAPVRRYLPDFAPHNPFGTDITLRHLMSHRAGIVRESPVGHYFDASAPSLAATVRSLDDTALVYAPGKAFKYSNPGIGVVGAVVAKVTGKRFEEAVQELVLAPLALQHSSFDPRPDLLAAQAHGVMWTYDGRAIPTPDFAFGYAPAANLRSTVDDLVAFASSWFADAPNRVLQPAVQQQMFTVQFEPAGTAKGCGLGFFVSDFDGHRKVAHGGAVYGFASTLAALPDDGIAVAVVNTVDFANAVSDAIADRALRAMLALRRGEQLPSPPLPQPVGKARALQLAGRYVGDDRWLDLLCRGDELVLRPDAGVDCRLRLQGETLVSDDRTSMGKRDLQLQGAGGVRWQGRVYHRRDTPPAAAPAALLPLLGDYGWDFDTMFVYEDEGRLCVLIEWCVRAVLQPTGTDAFRFADGTMYAGDQVVFERDEAGAVTACTVGGTRFPRLADAAAAGTFHIEPVAPIADLRRAALRASPPPQPDGLRAPELVSLHDAVPGLHYDVRYASTNNFLGTAVYDHENAMMQRPAAMALLAAQQQLAPMQLGLLIHDAYRPWFVTKIFWDATPVAQHDFVADPGKGSRHNRGCAVDLTLCELASGKPIEMASGYDEFTARAYPDYAGGTGRQRWYRELLRRTMNSAGFEVYEYEWWHFDFGDWRHYPVLNEPLK